MTTTILRSELDKSINFINPTPDGGAVEARFVQRLENTIIIYLSSTTGCDKACRFCHLTQTGQTTMTPVTVDGYIEQATEVFGLLLKEKKLDGVTTVHFNFMARGDALANPHFVNETEIIFHKLWLLAFHLDLTAKFKISTIFPISDLFESPKQSLKEWVANTLSIKPDIEFYYSLYSLDRSFRKRWIPKAIDPAVIGDVFCNTNNKMCLHHALIAGENTSYRNVVGIHDWLQKYNIFARVNIVRYNPFDEGSGDELRYSGILAYKREMIASPFVLDVNVVTRVGFDAKASCGMFVNAQDY